jgi:methylmalonyl-CoA/ethylmalonyl-CoA epimerase
MIIDHIGIVVKRMDEGVEQWTSIFGYSPLTKIVTNTRQKVNVLFLHKKNSCLIKLIEPTDDRSPVYSFARQGGGLHHLCFKCGNMSETIERFKMMGLHVLSDPQPGEAFENEKIAFIYAKQGLNIELIETEKKSNRLEIPDDP